MSVTVWHVQEFDSSELDSKTVGQFYSGDSYIIRWMYNVSIQGNYNSLCTHGRYNDLPIVNSK